MTSQVKSDGQVIPPLNITKPVPTLNLAGFKWASAATFVQRAAEPTEGEPGAAAAPQKHLDPQLEEQLREPGGPGSKPETLLPFPLAQFKGSYAGNGFNMIWR